MLYDAQFTSTTTAATGSRRRYQGSSSSGRSDDYHLAQAGSPSGSRDGGTYWDAPISSSSVCFPRRTGRRTRCPYPVGERNAPGGRGPACANDAERQGTIHRRRCDTRDFRGNGTDHRRTGSVVSSPGAAGWERFFDAGYAPALDRLEYIARAITPVFRPMRFDAARFFLVESTKV